MIESVLQEQLEKNNVSINEFSELLIRLLDYGVVCRDESQVETILYDRYVQCSDQVEDYLKLIGVRIAHDRQFCFVRIHPPGAQVPGLADENDQPFNSGFRQRLTQAEVALVLVLRAEYEKSLREGQIDEKGRVLIALEAVAIAMNHLLKRQLPEGKVERKNLFVRLRQLRLIQFNAEDELESEESWICILPSITSFVSDEVLSALIEQIPGQEQKGSTEAPLDNKSSLFNPDKSTHADEAKE